MSCLFNSLSHFLPEDSNQVRSKVCDYLQANKPLIDGIETRHILQLEDGNYISNMRSTSTWGGGIEIQASCNLWNLRIIVQNRRDISNKNIEFVPCHGNYNKTISIYWTVGHYEPIR